MSDLITATTRSVRFYACGGTAVNLLRGYRENQPTDKDVLAEEKYSYIDTSQANLVNVSLSDTYLLSKPDGSKIDGSGGDRSKNAAIFKKALPDILLNHEPADLNVVIFSAAGGSGSVSGPLLLEKLLSDDKTVVCVVIGSHDSLKRTTNTINTLQGLELVVSRTGRPVVIHYKENDLTKPHSVNNLAPQFVMQTLSMFASGKNAHLDSADVRNLFDYHVVTHHTPGLAMLDVYADAGELVEKVKKPIALAALLRSQEEVVPQVDPDSDTVGYLPAHKTEYKNSFYFVVSTQALGGVFGELNAKRENAAKQKQVQQKATSLLGGNTAADDDTGLVL